MLSAPPKQDAPTKDVQELLDQAALRDGREVEFLNQALLKARTIGDKIGEVRALITLGKTYRLRSYSYQTPETKLAIITYYEQARVIYHDLGDRKGEADMLQNLAELSEDLSLKADLYEQAQHLYHEIGSPTDEALVLMSLGSFQYQRQKREEAITAFQGAAACYRILGDHVGEAKALIRLGDTYSILLRPLQAKECYLQALPLLNDDVDFTEKLHAVVTLGTIFYDSGQMQRAVEFYTLARPLHRRARGRTGEISGLGMLGSAYAKQGNPERAAALYHWAALLCATMGYDTANATRWEAGLFGTLAKLYADTGQPQRAIEFYNRVLLIYSPPHTAIGESTQDNIAQSAPIWLNIGDLYIRLGQTVRALEYYKRTLDTYPKSETYWSGPTAELLAKMGRAYATLGQQGHALDFYTQAMDFYRKANLDHEVSMMLIRIGDTCVAQGQFNNALKFYNEAARHSRATYLKDNRSEAMAFIHTGRLLAQMGKTQYALRYYRASLQLFRVADNRQNEAISLGSIAAAEQRTGQTKAAERDYRAALTLLEMEREAPGALNATQTDFLPSHLTIYQNYIDFLLKTKRPQEAFVWTEKLKTRIVFDMMLNGNIDLSHDLSEQTREQEQQLWTQVDFENRQLDQDGRAEPELAAPRRAKLVRADGVLRAFTHSLYANQPSIPRRRAATTITLPQLAAFLPSDTALLEYVTLRAGATDDTILFCVTVENGKLQTKAYPLHTTAARLNTKTTGFLAACSNPRRPYATQARELSTLLLAPAQAQLRGKKHLLICPDGPLWRVPFAALLRP